MNMVKKKEIHFNGKLFYTQQILHYLKDSYILDMLQSFPYIANFFYT